MCSLSSLICLFPFLMSSERGKGESTSSFNNCFSIHHTLLASILSPSPSQMKKIMLIWKSVLSAWQCTHPIRSLCPSLLLVLPSSPAGHTATAEECLHTDVCTGKHSPCNRSQHRLQTVHSPWLLSQWASKIVLKPSN